MYVQQEIGYFLERMNREIRVRPLAVRTESAKVMRQALSMLMGIDPGFASHVRACHVCGVFFWADDPEATCCSPAHLDKLISREKRTRHEGGAADADSVSGEIAMKEPGH